MNEEIVENPRPIPEHGGGRNGMKIKNTDWERCTRMGIPQVLIRKFAKYAQFHYDMWTTDFDLSEEAGKTLYELVIDFMKTINTRGENDVVFPAQFFSWGSGTGSGLTPRMRIEETRILAARMKEIIMDKSNWVSCIGRSPATGFI